MEEVGGTAAARRGTFKLRIATALTDRALRLAVACTYKPHAGLGAAFGALLKAQRCAGATPAHPAHQPLNHGVVLEKKDDGAGMLREGNRLQIVQRIKRTEAQIRVNILEYMYVGTCVLRKHSRPRSAKRPHRRPAHSPIRIREFLHECVGVLRERTTIQVAQGCPHRMMAHKPVIDMCLNVLPFPLHPRGH